jgi:hypothetical protein
MARKPRVELFSGEAFLLRRGDNLAVFEEACGAVMIISGNA